MATLVVTHRKGSSDYHLAPTLVFMPRPEIPQMLSDSAGTANKGHAKVSFHVVLSKILFTSRNLGYQICPLQQPTYMTLYLVHSYLIQLLTALAKEIKSNKGHLIYSIFESP